IVISFDGFRYDYVTKDLTPNLYKLRETGATGHMLSQFITKTYPNHQSIATGLFVETHGIVSNEFYDPKYNSVFNVDTSPDSWWTEFPSTPVWTVNQIHGQYSGTNQWPGEHVKYRNIGPTHTRSFNPSISWHSRIDTIVKWITDPHKPANCVFMYFCEPDTHSHNYGPFSKQAYEQVKRADTLVGYLVDSLSRHNLLNTTNLIILSDHGFAEVRSSTVLKMNSIINPQWYTDYGSTPSWSIIPKPGYEDKVYETLLNASKTMPFTIYRRTDIPDHFHYSDNRRILPLFLITNEGWDVHHDTYAHPPGYPLWGNHGWDNRLASMRPLFVANGPAFKKGYNLTKEFMNTDLYPLMLTVLKLPVQLYPSNGSLDAVRELLSV
ncbi:ectonucleotide pyrophosphatase/phosphodiesterase family member 5-like, partial [Oppia nitens]|uniref:ectonucleotide pyrophosphatase/phosphodiesterase family member 5-like n=1 Tax=Oppia nitens TaxID=1686743 RepID=UPI0023DABFE6